LGETEPRQLCVHLPFYGVGHLDCVINQNHVIMNRLKKVKPNQRDAGQPVFERDDLERELVRHDKQALITDCLKIFDTNTMIFEQVETLKAQVKDLEARLDIKRARIYLLEKRTVWQVVNTRLQKRIEKMKSEGVKPITRHHEIENSENIVRHYVGTGAKGFVN
jgi:regulator of replication initiation timing